MNTIVFKRKSYHYDVDDIVRCHLCVPGQAVPGGLPAGGVGGRQGADLQQAQRGVRVDGRGGLLSHHQAAAGEAVAAQEPLQAHVLQGGGEAQVARTSGRPGQHAQHLQLLPQVTVAGRAAASLMSRADQDLDCS